MPMSNTWKNYLRLMEREIVPALGCTEPVAVALAAARCAAVLGGDTPPDSLELRVSRNILKNAMSVIIPGTSLYGVDYAGALGFSGGDWEKGLQVLEGLSDSQIERACGLVRDKVVTVSLKTVEDTIYIEAEARRGAETARVAIQGRHDHFVLAERNGETLFSQKPLEEGGHEVPLDGMSLRDLYEFATMVELEQLSFIQAAYHLNSAISREGLKNPYGLGLGKSMRDQQSQGIIGKDLTNNAIMATTAAIDARMAGCALPVMSNSGSGNQGITATVPVCVVAEQLGADEETTIRALIISHLTAIYIKQHLDRLSALCGAMVAAAGVSCAVVYLLGGGYSAIAGAVANLIGNITGIICDGAKAGCSLKVYASLQAAFSAAYLALEGVSVSETEGIITDDVETTIDNLGKLAEQGMKQTDQVILDIMLSKSDARQ